MLDVIEAVAGDSPTATILILHGLGADGNDFVPVAEDFSNLEDRLAWCLAHDDECRAIARRARARVGEVYRPEWAGARLAAALREKLGDPVSVAS